jgi:hypothetical protein
MDAYPKFRNKSDEKLRFNLAKGWEICLERK